jgi:uncharacterized protein (DUF1697 family)
VAKCAGGTDHLANTMPTYVALLRGVNVGKAKRVPMADLRDVLAGLGYTEVTTLLNSGNAAFRSTVRSASACATTITRALAGQFGFDVPVVVKSAQELGAIVAGNPLRFTAADHSRLLAVFVQDSGQLASLRGLDSLAVPPEQFKVGSQGAYLLCASGLLESRAAAALLGKAGRTVTTRNWATVLKLHALALSVGA